MSKALFTETYPFNLAYDLFECGEKVREIYLKGLFTVIATLTEREQEVLRLRYSEGLTLQKAAEVLGITRERVRQVQAKALIKLRHPSKSREYLAVSLAEKAKDGSDYHRLKEENDLLKKALSLLVQKHSNVEAKQFDVDKVLILEAPIEHLNFSDRAYNCLKRAGKNTVGDITEMHETDLLKVRNMGLNSIKEVKEILSKHGLSLRGADNV